MSSSSDEDLSKFSEATDVKLFNNSLFAQNKGEHSTNIPVKPSLRYLETPDENRIDLKVTPGFQKHVASRLMKILDSSLDQGAVLTEQTSVLEHDPISNCTSGLSPIKPEGGIKLFGASAAFIASCNITPPPPTKRWKRGRRVAGISSASDDDSSSNEVDVTNLPKNKDSSNRPKKLGVHDETDLSERFAACAVSSEWILNGEAVKDWAPSHKNKKPIQGEATPDLIKMASVLTSKSVKHKKKKRKHKEQSSTGEIEKADTQQSKKRGKRGSKKSRKKMDTEIENLGDVQDLAENAEFVLPKPPKRKKKRSELIEDLCDKIVNSEEIQESKIGRELCEKFKKTLHDELSSQGGLQETSNKGANLDEFPKKKKKKKRKSSKQADMDLSLNLLLKKIKKKKRRKERENELPMPVLEDEGFDSDPTKADGKRREQRKLLKVQLKKRKKSEKKWQNKMEYLSKDLANLMMTNVKKD